jgi:hypothetical protein
MNRLGVLSVPIKQVDTIWSRDQTPESLIWSVGFFCLWKVICSDRRKQSVRRGIRAVSVN